MTEAQQKDAGADSREAVSYGSTVATLLRGWYGGDPTVSLPERFTRITADSGEVVDGALFVALRGTNLDGHEFIADAIRRGAVAVLVEDETAVPGDAGVPVIRVKDTRDALAELAAEWYGRPADGLPLVGITGTAGKTSTLTILEAILTAAGMRTGTIGSLGLRVAGETLEETGYTVPDPLLLHGEMARLRRESSQLAAMEVTSHALDQQRVAGLCYNLGIFTNLLPLEHSEYHGDLRGYVDAKSRFFDHLEDCAPLVYNIDDPIVRRLVHGRRIDPVSCGSSRAARVRVEGRDVSRRGTRLSLHLRRPLRRLDGSRVEPQRIDLKTNLLGRSNVANATLATVSALCLGAESEQVAETLAEFKAPKRRMQIVHHGRFTILDDTVGHPDSISSLFEVVQGLDCSRVHAVFAVRGQRGPKINGQSAAALAIWARRLDLESVILSCSAEAADERNRVEPEEIEAFRRPLEREGVRWTEHERLDTAVRAALSAADEGDLVLLLGAQGMDEGADVAQAWLAENAMA